MNVESLFYALGITTVVSPISLLACMGLSSLFGIKLSESVVSKLTQITIATALVPAVAILILMLATDSRFVSVDIGDWVSIPQQHFHFHLKFIFDRLSVPFLLLSLVLCGVVGAFTRRYLHREQGYNRFFLLYSLFLAGMVLSAVAGTIETLFFGWEMVGLSSALLVAYFHERESPVKNGQRVWSVYRLADAAFLIGALTMHHLTGEGDFASFVGSEPWPGGTAQLSSTNALIVGLLLLLAASGKSALVPFSGWLPRAMEGPTPSSAVFYGSLSVHLGAYLLLRVSPILEASPLLQWIVVFVGAISAIAGSVMSRVQSDVKSSLAYASLSQVGIIVVEIGLGYYYLALVHIVGHACMRTLQLLRAPTLLSDYHAMENAIGGRWSREPSKFATWLPKGLQLWAYRFGFERGYMDAVLDNWIVRPFVTAFRWADRQERRWTDWLSTEPSRESDKTELHPESFAESLPQGIKQHASQT
jgi:NADH:ubiquinone oxidoreductase subunit 5 (subunit L)/multisubunit Na+/H+ antiporter MnhA subunit